MFKWAICLCCFISSVQLFKTTFPPVEKTGPIISHLIFSGFSTLLLCLLDENAATFLSLIKTYCNSDLTSEFKSTAAVTSDKANIVRMSSCSLSAQTNSPLLRLINLATSKSSSDFTCNDRWKLINARRVFLQSRWIVTSVIGCGSSRFAAGYCVLLDWTQVCYIMMEMSLGTTWKLIKCAVVSVYITELFNITDDNSNIITGQNEWQYLTIILNN